MRVKSNTMKGGTGPQGTKCGKVVQLINVLVSIMWLFLYDYKIKKINSAY